MIEELSEIDSSKESDVDRRVRMDEINTNLQEEINSLLLQNQTLKAQFDHAVEISEQSVKLKQQINDLTERNRELSNQKDDLMKRNAILTQLIKESEEKLKSEKECVNQKIMTIQKQSREDLEKSKNNYETLLNSLRDEIDSLISQMMSYGVDEKVRESQYKKITGIFNNVMSTKFEKIDDLCEYLENNNDVVTKKLDSSQSENQTDNMENQLILQLQKKHKKEQKRRSMAENALFNIEQELQQQQRKNKTRELELSAKIQSLNEQIERINDDHKFNEENYQHQIKLLENRIDTLKREQKVKEVKAKETAPVENIIITTTQPIIRHQQPQQIQTENDELSEINQQLISQINELKKVKEESTSRIRRLEEELQINKAELCRTKAELDTAQSKLGETAREFGEYRRNYVDREQTNYEQKITQLKTDLKTAKAQSVKLVSEMQSQKRKNSDLEHEIEKVRRENHDLRVNETTLKSQISELEDNVQRIKSERDFVQYNTFKQQPKQIDTIPQQMWHTNVFDPILTTAIDQIINSMGLQPSTKLQSIYHTIASHFDQITKQTKTELENTRSELSDLKIQINKILVDLSIATLGSPMSLDHFLNEGGNQIINTLSKIRSESDSSRKELSKANQILDYLSREFSFRNGSNIEDEIYNLHRDFITAMQQLTKSKNKSKKLKDEIKRLKKSHDADTENFRSEILELNEKIDRLTLKSKSMNGNTSNLRKALNEAQMQLRDSEARYNELLYNSKIEKESLLKQISSNSKQNETRIQVELSKANQNIQELESQLQDKERKIIRLKKAYNLQKDSVKQLVTELNKVNDENDERMKSFIEQKNQEAASADVEYRRTVSTLEAENSGLRDDIEKMARELNKKSKRATILKESNEVLENEKIRLERELLAKMEEMERAQKLSDSAARSTIMTAEANYISRLNELRAKMDADKRRCYTFVADEFRRFYSPSDSIDEAAFKAILGRVKEALSRYETTENTIRRTVGAIVGQSTEDAVAMAMIANKRC